MQFEWNENKNQVNKKKHGVSFELACLIFEDPCILSVPDQRFDYDEERWQSLGLIKDVVVYVAHIIIEENTNGEEIIRLISARKATPNETKKYNDNRQNAKRT